MHRNDYQKALEILKPVCAHIKARDIVSGDKIAKVSIVGVGMRSHAGIASTAFRALAEEGINIQMISTSEIKISVVIDEKYTELAVRVLHKVFDLDQPGCGAELGRLARHNRCSPKGAGGPRKAKNPRRTPPRVLSGERQKNSSGRGDVGVIRQALPSTSTR